jgi:hypothetical protein
MQGFFGMATGPCQAGFAGTHYYIYLGGGEEYDLRLMTRHGLTPPKIANAHTTTHYAPSPYTSIIT